MSAPSFTYSGNVYTAGTAGAVDFSLVSTTGNAIPYLEPSHIHVYKSANQGTTWTELTRPSQWNFVTNGTVARLATGIAAGEWVKVQRITPSSSAYVTFQPSSLLTADQLNDDTLFNTYLNQELYDQGNQSAAIASGAETAANAATTAANAATTAANNANTTAATAATAASNATSAAAASTAASTAAAAAAAQATTDAATAIASAATANSNASTALSTANAANVTANQAAAAVSQAVLFTLVSNVASIPASPANNTYIEVSNSTGIESFSPLIGLPGGFAGDAGLTVRIRYTTTGATWNYLSYFANNPETRYLGPNNLASQAEAETGSNNTKWTTPLRVAQAIAALATSGATGGGTDKVFVQNDQAITTSYTIPSGKNASSVGPVSIDAGVTVTISANSTWVIL